MTKILMIFLMIIFPSIVVGQETRLSETIINIAEELAADESDPDAVSTYLERLTELAENPVKINSSSEDEISRLFFLSDFQVKALADYVRSSGKMVSVYELAAIPGFDRETAGMIIPFITLDYKSSFVSDSTHWRNNLISNFSIKTGTRDTSSLGSIWKILTKYKFSAGNFSGGVTAEKDPGEQLLAGIPRLPDFLSAHLAFQGDGLLRKVIIGDFSARFGQGTNINTGMPRGVSLSSPGYMSASDEIKPYSSAEGNRFFRGVAAEFSLKNFELSVFLSNKKTDATVSQLPGTTDAIIVSFYQSGLHNTATLLQKKDAVSESAYGLNLSFNISNLKAGVIFSENRFSLPVYLPSSDPSKMFDFSGVRNNLSSVYYNAFIRNILFYGEFSVSDMKKYAAIQGISIRPSDRLMVNFLYRSFNSGYISFYGNTPGSNTKTTNEKGLLGNFTYEAAKHLFISGGVDLQNYPWLKYRCSGPTTGRKSELRARYLPTEKITIEASYTYRSSMLDNSVTSGIPEQQEITTMSLRGSVRYSFSDNLSFGTRMDYKTVQPSKSRGVLLLQDISYKFRKIPFTIWFRYCLFNTDSWDSRLYTYENDLLYSFSIPALTGEGSRSYIMVKWNIGSVAELRIKYGITSIVTSRTSAQNTDEVKMQFKIWF